MRTGTKVDPTPDAEHIVIVKIALKNSIINSILFLLSFLGRCKCFVVTMAGRGVGSVPVELAACRFAQRQLRRARRHIPNDHAGHLDAAI